MGKAIKASSVDNTFFVNPSAIPFLSREIQLKEMDSKEDAIELISAKMPYKPTRGEFALIALIRVAESDSHLIFDSPMSLHFSKASRSARPSAASGVVTWCAIEEKEESLPYRFVIHPSPARFRDSFQAASVLSKT